MKDSDRILLEGLALVTDATPEQWTLVVKAVEDAGSIASVRGQARAEIQRAVEKTRLLVEKHPGHGDQSVHGGSRGKGGSTGSPEAAQKRVTAEGKKSAKAVAGHANDMTRAVAVTGTPRGSIDDVEIMGISEMFNNISSTLGAMPPGRKAGKQTIETYKKQVQDAVIPAMAMQPANKKAVLTALRAVTTELNSLGEKIDGAWDGIEDTLSRYATP